MSIDSSAIANRMVRDGRYKYIYYHGYPDQLFDIANDPDETRDVSDDPAHKEVREKLRSVALDGWDPNSIVEQMDRKAKDVDILKRWTQATNAQEDYRWVKTGR